MTIIIYSAIFVLSITHKHTAMQAIARFTTKAQAEAFRNRAFETANQSLMIVEADGYELHTRKSAAAMEKQGYNVY